MGVQRAAPVQVKSKLPSTARSGRPAEPVSRDSTGQLRPRRVLRSLRTVVVSRDGRSAELPDRRASVVSLRPPFRFYLISVPLFFLVPNQLRATAVPWWTNRKYRRTRSSRRRQRFRWR